MKKPLIFVFLFFSMFYGYATPLFKVEFEIADSQWLERFFEELEKHLENELISGETYKIIEHILEEDMYDKSPEMSALKIYQTALEIEEQLRKGVLISRIKMEARRRLRLYKKSVELPLFLDKGSRSRNQGEFPDINPHNNTFSSRGMIRNGESGNGHKGFNGNE